MKIQNHFPLLDHILAQWAEVMGNQYHPYKNHVYRVVNFCFAFHECDAMEAEKIIIAGCFHDLGIWPDDSFDYLKPSIALARTYLTDHNKVDWLDEIGLMIDLHHKIRRVKDDKYPLVEIFRKGDWVDASMGLRTFGLPRRFMKDVQAAFPNLGFHKNLLRLGWKQFRQYPFHPMPMMKW